MSLKEMENDLEELLCAQSMLKGNAPHIDNLWEAVDILLHVLIERTAEEVAIERGG